jgi:hypothetical protein
MWLATKPLFPFSKGTNMARKLPPIKDLKALLIFLKTTIGDDYRAGDCFGDEESSRPSMSVTIGWSPDGSWSYQTGDNSFTGGAYGHPHWAVITLERRSNSLELARDIQSQLMDLVEC